MRIYEFDAEGRLILCDALSYAAEAKPEFVLPLEQQATFQGFRRKDGRAGTRNYVGILTSVNCSASAARWSSARRSGPKRARSTS